MVSVNSKSRVGGLRGIREARGLSQEAVARLADVSLATVQNTERGYRPQRSEAVPRIAAALTVSVSDLYNDDAPAGINGGRVASGAGARHAAR